MAIQLETNQFQNLSITTAKLAADAVNGSKIADDAIGSEHLAAGAVNVTALSDAAVSTAKLAADAVNGSKIADDAIDSEHIAAGSIDSEHFSAGAVSESALGSNVVSFAKLKSADIQTTLSSSSSQLVRADAIQQAIDDAIDGRQWKTACVVATTANVTLSGEQTIDGITTSTSRILVWQQSTSSQNGIYVTASGAWARASDFDGSGDKIAGSAVLIKSGSTYDNTQFVCTNNTDPSVGSDAITFAEMQAGVANGSITTAKLAADAVNGSKIADDAVDSEHIAAGAIDSEHFSAGAVNAAALGASAVTEDKLNNAAVTQNKIADAAVSTAKISDAAISTAKLAADCIDGTKIADDAVDSEHIAAGAIDSEHFSAGSVNATALGANAVTEAKLNNGAVSQNKLSDAAVATSKIADLAVSKAKIAADSIDGDKVDFQTRWATFAGDGSATTFDLAVGLHANFQQVMVSRNGAIQKQVGSSPADDSEYTVSLTGGSGSVGRITFGSAPSNGAVVLVFYVA